MAALLAFAALVLWQERERRLSAAADHVSRTSTSTRSPSVVLPRVSSTVSASGTLTR